jgi:hypothetical protein
VKLEQICSALERRRRCHLDPQRRLVDRDSRRMRRRLGEDGIEPVQLVDEPNDRPRSGAQSGRPVRGREEHPMKRSDRRPGACDRFFVLGSADPTLEEKGSVGAQTGCDRPAGRNRGVAQRIPSGRRPQERHREQRRDGGQAPAGETVGDRRNRAGE